MNLKGLFNVLSTKPNYNKVMVMTLTVRDKLVSCHVFAVLIIGLCFVIGQQLYGIKPYFFL